MVSKATPALLNHSGPNLALPCLSYLTPSLVPSRTAYGPTRHNMPTFGTVIYPLMHTWLRGSAPPGGGNSRSSHPTSLKLYVASFSLSQRISFTTSESGLAHRRLHPVLLEPTHRNSDCLNQQCPTGLSVRHRLQTLAALSSSPISNAADSHHQDFFPSALSWSH